MGELVPGTFDTTTDVSLWKSKITMSWKAAAEGILKVAKDLYDARDTLKSQDKSLWAQLQTELHQENIISEAIQKKLLVIGDKYAALLPIASALPPRYNAIYELSHFSERELLKLVRSSKLTPDLEDREVRALVHPAGKSTIATAPPDRILAKVVELPEFSVEDAAKVRRLLRQLAKVPGLELRLTSEGESFLEEASE